jgi:hypothetical protein
MVPRRRAASRPARTAAIASSGRRALVGPAHGQGGVPPGATVGFRSERENSPPAASAPARTIAIASSGMRALVGPAHTALARKGRNSLASVAGAPAPARTGAVPDGRRTARAGFLLERLSAFGAKGGTPRPQPAGRPGQLLWRDREGGRWSGRSALRSFGKAETHSLRGPALARPRTASRCHAGTRPGRGSPGATVGFRSERGNSPPAQPPACRGSDRHSDLMRPRGLRQRFEPAFGACPSRRLARRRRRRRLHRRPCSDRRRSGCRRRSHTSPAR